MVDKTRPQGAAPRLLPWPAVAGSVAVILVLLGYFTLYLPAKQPHADEVRVGDVTARLLAWPHAGSAPISAARLVDFDLTLSGPIDDITSVDFSTTMPTMANMSGRVTAVAHPGPGHYTGLAGLDMGGLWQVQAHIHHQDGGSRLVTFDVRV